MGWSQVTEPCGLLDDRGSACGRPFTATDARVGKVKFDLVIDAANRRGVLVRFGFINGTQDERKRDLA